MKRCQLIFSYKIDRNDQRTMYKIIQLLGNIAELNKCKHFFLF